MSLLTNPSQRLAVFLLCCLAASPLSAEDRKPNVILVITDDQGYGDIAAHGNKMIKTPNLDSLHSLSLIHI